MFLNNRMSNELRKCSELLFGIALGEADPPKLPSLVLYPRASGQSFTPLDASEMRPYLLLVTCPLSSYCAGCQ